MKHLTLVAMLLSACGPHRVIVSQDGPLVVKHQIDLDSLLPFFESECREEMPYADVEEINVCAQRKLADFIGGLS